MRHKKWKTLAIASIVMSMGIGAAAQATEQYKVDLYGAGQYGGVILGGELTATMSGVFATNAERSVITAFNVEDSKTAYAPKTADISALGTAVPSAKLMLEHALNPTVKTVATIPDAVLISLDRGKLVQTKTIAPMLDVELLGSIFAADNVPGYTCEVTTVAVGDSDHYAIGTSLVTTADMQWVTYEVTTVTVWQMAHADMMNGRQVDYKVIVG